MRNTVTVQFLENKIKENPKSLVFARLASMYIEQGRIDDAVNLLEQGIHNNPSYVTGYFILAKAYIAKNEREKAEEALKKVLSHDRFYLKAHKLLGDLMARVGWENKAAIHYRDILLIDPLDIETEQMLDTFSFSVEVPESKPINPPKKERDWISGSPPVFEKSAKVSEIKQELNKPEPAGQNDFDLSDFEISEPISKNDEPNKHAPAGLTETGELDLSDFDLDSFKPDSKTEIPEPSQQEVLTPASDSSSGSVETSETDEKEPDFTPSDTTPKIQDMSEFEIKESPLSPSGTDLEADENKFEDLPATTETEPVNEETNPDPDTSGLQTETQETEEAEEPFFEEGFLSSITGTTEDSALSDKPITEAVQEHKNISDSPDMNDLQNLFEEPEQKAKPADALFKDEEFEIKDEDMSRILIQDNKETNTDNTEQTEINQTIAENIEEQTISDKETEKIEVLPEEESAEITETAQDTIEIAAVNLDSHEPEAENTVQPDLTTEQETTETEKPENTQSESAQTKSPKIISPTLGEIYAAQGQFKKAIQVYETLLGKNPSEAEKYNQKINELKKKMEEAE